MVDDSKYTLLTLLLLRAQKGNMKKPASSLSFLSIKRGHKLQKRRLKRSKDSRLKSSATPLAAYHSNALDTLTKACRKPWRGGGKVLVKVPDIFSVITNPIACIETFQQFAALTRTTKLYRIIFDHSGMSEVDLAAESVLDLLAVEMRREFGRKRIPAIGGFFPEDQKLERFIRAIGIIKSLHIKHEFLDRKEEERLEIFQKRNKKQWSAEHIGDQEYKDKVVADFVRHVDRCLHHQSMQLRPMARTLLSLYTGEILDNAEEHTEQGDWAISGYLDTNSEPRVCEIALFNFGKTFSDTFKELPRNSFAWLEVEPYIDEHSRKGWFSKGWQEDDLLTLVALQGGISSKNTCSDDDRGQGTVELIEFFQQMHKECIDGGKSCAKMAILSGATHILFDGTYSMVPNSSGRKIIAFNKENDLSLPPDENFVSHLDSLFFPGTIISIRFPMQNAQTEAVAV